MTREIFTHKVNGLNDALVIETLDPPGAGGANHLYKTTYFLSDGNSEAQLIKFQNGPIAENGVNGTSNEALLAIVADRLIGFQSSSYACRENALALTKVQEAMHWLHHRTKERASRGVEGTSKI